MFRPWLPQIGLTWPRVEERPRTARRSQPRNGNWDLRLNLVVGEPSTLVAGDLRPVETLIGPDIAGESEHPLTENVLHNLGGSPLNRVRS